MEGFVDLLIRLGVGTLEFINTPIIIGVFVFSALVTIVIMLISRLLQSIFKKRN
ncbi:hypothetical protein LCGC14_0692140 [marine sediment metagenome]|uniref:Uncharacterized protein n=1 Tax=marine sediment metagenome TaxID=412755 RepID=A0A0F9QQ19_9ZZZZ